MKFICPKCAKALAQVEGGAAKCPAGHSFDRSREGYYNLLISGGGTHGDNREMVAARREFLATGAYLPLAEAVARRVADIPCKAPCVLDVGCGEGYYTSIIADNLPEGNVYGFDISKDAVRQAAKKNKSLSLAVASAYHMPFADESFDGAVNVFSPLALEETRRILRHGGRFIMAIPGENHLFAMKSAIYDTPYKNEVQDTALPGFKLLSMDKIAYDLNLDTPEKIRTLFMMTPYAYRTRREDAERLLARDSLVTEAEFYLLVYERV